MPALSAEDQAKLTELQAQEATLKTELVGLNERLAQAKENAAKSVNMLIKGRFLKQATGLSEKITAQEKTLKQVQEQISRLLP